jgi:hypothetical protein
MVLEGKVNWVQIHTWANGTNYINDNGLKKHNFNFVNK